MSIQDHHALTPRAIEGFRRREHRKRNKIILRRAIKRGAKLSKYYRFALSRLLSDNGLELISISLFGRHHDPAGLLPIKMQTVRGMCRDGLIRFETGKPGTRIYLSDRGRAIAEALEREAGE